MSNSVWIVVNAGGNSRAKEVADEFNARACFELTEQHFEDQADILATEPFRQARGLRVGDRIAMHQGGGRQWRPKYGSGMLMACGCIREQARRLEARDVLNFSRQYSLTQQYFPPGKNQLIGIVFYTLSRAKQRLPIEHVYVRPVRGNKFIEVSPNHHGYDRLNRWWNENCQGQDTIS